MINQIFKLINGIKGENRVYIVGGWLRDKLLKKPNRDLDLTVSSNAYSFASKIARLFKGSLVVLDEENMVYRVILKDNRYLDYIDVSKFKGTDINCDLKNRDFTVNSFAVPFEDNIDFSKITDPFKGLKDLKDRIIRATTINSFKDDPLRMLRAYRFKSELAFKIDPKTNKLIKAQACLIKKSSPERIREELFKILSGPDASLSVKEMDKSGLLEVILPEIIKMKKSARRFYFHPLGLWQHSIETLQGLEEILGNLNTIFKEVSGKVTRHLQERVSGPVNREGLLKIVALLHDVAKPSCAKRVGNKMRFLGHESKGSKMVASILKRLKASNRETAVAKLLVEHHMRPINLGQSKVITQRAIYRLFRDIGDNVVDLMLLTLADCYSYRRLKTKKAVELRKQKAMALNLVTKYFEEKEKTPRPKLIDGHIIMKAFNLKPGPVIGKLLKAVNEAQMIGKISTQDEALRLSAKHLTAIQKRDKLTSGLSIKPLRFKD